MNSTYFLNCVAGNVFGSQTAPALPTSYYLGLSTTQPNLDGSGVTEPKELAGYARVKLDCLSVPKEGVITNTETIDFNESTADWGTITHFVVFDSPDVNSGHLLMYGNLSTARTVETATIMTIKKEYLKLSVQNANTVSVTRA